MTFAIESRIKSVARTRVTSNRVFSNPRRVRKTAESLPNVDPNPLVLDCMRMMTISSTDSSIWAACRYGAKGYVLPISVMAGVRLPIIAYAGRTGRRGGPATMVGRAPDQSVRDTRVNLLSGWDARFYSVTRHKLRGLRSSYLFPSG